MRVVVNLTEITDVGQALLTKHNNATKLLKCYPEACSTRLSRIKSLLVKKLYELNAITSKPKSRSRRSWDSLGSMLKKMTGVLDHDDEQTINNNFETLQRQQMSMIEESTQIKHVSVRTFEKLNETLDYVNSITTGVEEALRDAATGARLQQHEENMISALKQATSDFADKVDAIVELISKMKISNHLISIEELDIIC